MDLSDITVSITKGWLDAQDTTPHPVYWEVRNSSWGSQVIDGVWDPARQEFVSPLHAQHVLTDRDISSNMMDVGADYATAEQVAAYCVVQKLCVKAIEESAA